MPCLIAVLNLEPADAPVFAPVVLEEAYRGLVSTVGWVVGMAVFDLGCADDLSCLM